MSGNRPFDPVKFCELILYVGQQPLRAGRVALAVILWQSDFEAYRRLGQSITGQDYIKAQVPGQPEAPRGLLAAIRFGWRWGAVEHRLRRGALTRRDANWIAAQWRNGVPV